MGKAQQKVIPVNLGFVKAFIVKGRGCILVDAGIPGSSKKIIGKLREEGIDPASVSLIIATHAHADHVGDLPELVRLTGAKVAVHRYAAERLRDGMSEEITPAGISGRILRAILKQEADIKPQEPDIVIDEEMDLGQFGIEGKVIHTPGHTKGSVSVVLSGGEAITGDLVFGSMFLNGFKGNYSPFFYDQETVKQSMKKVLSFAPKVILPSHGGPCKLGVLAAKLGI